MTTAEAARTLDIGPSTLKRWADDGKIKSFRTSGGHRRFSRDLIEQLRRSQRRPRAEQGPDRLIQLALQDDDPMALLQELLVAGLRPVVEELRRRLDEGRLDRERARRAARRLREVLRLRGRPATPSDDLEQLDARLAELAEGTDQLELGCAAHEC